MCVDNSSSLDVVAISRQCNISCRLVLNVKVLHETRWSTLGIVQSIGGKFLTNRGLIPQDLCKEIGAQEKVEIDYVWVKSSQWAKR